MNRRMQREREQRLKEMTSKKKRTNNRKNTSGRIVQVVDGKQIRHTP